MPATALLLPTLPAALMIGVVASRAVVAAPAGERFAGTWRTLLAAARTPGGIAAIVAIALGAVAIVLLAPVAYWPAAGWMLFLGVTLTIIDIRHHRLPDKLTIPGLPVLMALLLIPAISDGQWDAWVRSLAGAGLMLGVYLIGWIVAGLGYGDVRLSPTIGAVTAWFGWGALAVGVVATLAIAVLIGSVIVGAKMIRAPRGERWRALRKTPMAFGPAMFLGALVAVVWSEPILDWYVQLVL